MEEGKKGCGGGPINSSAAAHFDGGEQLGVEVECPEPEPPTRTTQGLGLGLGLGLDDKVPFLQMLQTLYSSNIPLKAENQILELDSCITHDIQNLHSPVMSSEAKGLTQMSPDGRLEEEKGEPNSCRAHQSKPLLSGRKMRKPKHAKVVVKNNKDAEKQRMTHIAVERNRRRQMSDYLIVLRSLLPHDYAPKGDQASIVGGVIDYVKKLEHHLQHLQTQKRQRKMDEIRSSEASNGVSTSTSYYSSDALEENCAKKRQLGEKANVKIMVVQTHANVHIECEDMKQSQLIKFLAALEELGLTILHLNINSSFYSLSLKVEDECKTRSAEEISGAVEKLLEHLQWNKKKLR